MLPEHVKSGLDLMPLVQSHLLLPRASTRSARQLIPEEFPGAIPTFADLENVSINIPTIPEEQPSQQQYNQEEEK
jgi:hypothetical protein